MKKSLILLVIREIQVENAVGYHYVTCNMGKNLSLTLERINENVEQHPQAAGRV